MLRSTSEVAALRTRFDTAQNPLAAHEAKLGHFDRAAKHVSVIKTKIFSVASRR
jgi:hypothetical protein